MVLRIWSFLRDFVPPPGVKTATDFAPNASERESSPASASPSASEKCQFRVLQTQPSTGAKCLQSHETVHSLVLAAVKNPAENYASNMLAVREKLELEELRGRISRRATLMGENIGAPLELPLYGA